MDSLVAGQRTQWKHAIGKLPEVNFVPSQIAAQQGRKQLTNFVQFIARSHAGARTNQNCNADRLFFRAKERNLLWAAVFREREISGGQAMNVAATTTAMD
jgi:hypothetical protein